MKSLIIMRRKYRIITTIIILTPLLGLAIAYAWYNNATTAPAGNSSEISEIVVEEGSTLIDIAPELERQKLINSFAALRAYLWIAKPNVNLQAGVYQIPRNLNLSQLISLINEGPKTFTAVVTIPEGLRYDEVGEKLDDALEELRDSRFSLIEFTDIVEDPDQYEFSPTAQQFLDEHKPAAKPLEGFLFPDTYVIAADAAAIDVVNLMIETLASRLEEAGIDPSANTRLDSFYEVLTLATITEREANNLADMKIVGDIFLRRIENGWPIGADATLLYPHRDWSYELTLVELQDASNPYNTRIRLGLPPTPIANPGIDGIKGITSPTPNEYYYFVSADGVNYYAKTLQEHQRNIEKWL